jgi:hypothetical protein
MWAEEAGGVCVAPVKCTSWVVMHVLESEPNTCHPTTSTLDFFLLSVNLKIN